MVSKLSILIVLAVYVSATTARPFFFWHPVQPENQASLSDQQHGHPHEEAAKAAAAAAAIPKEGQTSQANPADIHQRIHGHLNQLVSHGSTAMRSVIDTVQPDIKNIGQDLSEAYHVTRDRVNKSIEPTLTSAQKTVEPLINSAKEEVPKALSKVGEQVRGVWDKVTSVAQGDANNGGSVAQQTIKQAGDHLQQTINNAPQQPIQAAQQMMAHAHA